LSEILQKTASTYLSLEKNLLAKESETEKNFFIKKEMVILILRVKKLQIPFSFCKAEKPMGFFNLFSQCQEGNCRSLQTRKKLSDPFSLSFSN